MEIYLDNAATSHPKPEAVTRAVMRAMSDDNANPGRSGHSRAIRAAITVWRAREALTRLLGASDPASVVFAFNCTDALNLAIKGSLSAGAHAICSALEHNSVLRVLYEMKRRGIISLTVIAPNPSGEIEPDDIERAIEPNTKLIALTHASNVTGAVQPVAAVGRIARAHNIRYLIDGAQALGSIPVNVEKLMCDLYAFPGHKGVLGPQGTGGLYIASGIVLSTLREGGTGSSSERVYQPDELPERYEAGTVNLPGIAGLGAGAEYVLKHSEEILAHERALTRELYEGLRLIKGVTLYTPENAAARVGVVSFNVGALASAQVADALNNKQICVRAGLHCAPFTHNWLGTISTGAVRASVGWRNTLTDINALLSATAEIARQ